MSFFCQVWTFAKNPPLKFFNMGGAIGFWGKLPRTDKCLSIGVRYSN